MTRNRVSQIDFAGSSAQFHAAIMAYHVRMGAQSPIRRLQEVAGVVGFNLRIGEIGKYQNAQVLTSPARDGSTHVDVSLVNGDWGNLEPHWLALCAWLDGEGWLGEMPEPTSRAPDPGSTWKATFDWYYARLPSWARLDYDAIGRAHGYSTDAVRKAHERYSRNL